MAHAIKITGDSVLLDGKELPEYLSMSIHFNAAKTQAFVHLDDATTEILTRLGWTPPHDDERPRADIAPPRDEPTP